MPDDQNSTPELHSMLPRLRGDLRGVRAAGFGDANQTGAATPPEYLAGLRSGASARDGDVSLLNAVIREREAEIERLRAENVRMVDALSEIANRSGNDRGADWARGRAKEGLSDG